MLDNPIYAQCNKNKWHALGAGRPHQNNRVLHFTFCFKTVP